MAAVAALALAGWFGGRSLQGRLERRKALELARRQNFDRAEPLLEKALRRDPRDFEVVRALAVGYFDAGRLSESRPYLMRWCELRPNDPEPYRRRLVLWWRLGLMEQALADGRRVLELDPEDSATRGRVALLLSRTGRLEAAERECRRCLERDPNDLPLLLVLADVYRMEGAADKARGLLERLGREHPRSTGVMMGLGRLELETGHPEQAAPLLRQVVERDPHRQQEACSLLSQALARANRPEEAQQALARLQQMHEAERLAMDSAQQEGNLELQVRTAQALWKVGKGDQARAKLEQVLERDPTHAEARRLLTLYGEVRTAPPADEAGLR